MGRGDLAALCQWASIRKMRGGASGKPDVPVPRELQPSNGFPRTTPVKVRADLAEGPNHMFLGAWKLAGDCSAGSSKASHQDVCCLTCICAGGYGGRLSATKLSSLLRVKLCAERAVVGGLEAGSPLAREYATGEQHEGAALRPSHGGWKCR